MQDSNDEEWSDEDDADDDVQPFPVLFIVHGRGARAIGKFSKFDCARCACVMPVHQVLLTRS